MSGESSNRKNLLNINKGNFYDLAIWATILTAGVTPVVMEFIDGAHAMARADSLLMATGGFVSELIRSTSESNTGQDTENRSFVLSAVMAMAILGMGNLNARMGVDLSFMTEGLAAGILLASAVRRIYALEVLGR